MFPETECILFSTSTHIQLHPTPSYKEYLQKIYQDKTTLVADLQGFFQMDGYRYKELFGCIPRVHVLVDPLQYVFPSLSSSIESTQMSKEFVESLSYDSRGVLFSMVEGNELRLHETSAKPCLTMLQSFSEDCVGIEPIESEIPPLLLQIIEEACLK
jgi:hypothetical protein